MKYIAVIPARGGSKGIPEKNIKIINGRPLIAYTIEQALKSGLFEHVFVNTESVKIADIAKQYGAEVPFLRPEELASDTATTLDTMKHAIIEYEKISAFDALFLLQPTSPFRKMSDFAHVKELLESGAPACATYSPAQEHPSRMKFIKDHKITDIIAEPASLRRQEMGEVFVRNGAIYAFRKEVPFEQNTLLPEHHLPHIMDSFAAVNIDAPFDMLIAELLLTHVWKNGD